jgi:alpha-N-arabinofuranosidase
MSSSPSFNRRAFIRTGAAALGAVAASPRLATALASLAPLSVPGLAGTEVRIDVLTNEPIAPVTSTLYGHFIEHLGGVIYDGVWVGEQSKIPNIGGIRKALVDDLRRLTPGIVRWPGGCFADSYDWADGIGARQKRPRRTNFWTDELPATVAGASRYEPNHFGTSEFLRFCQLVGAEPYLAVNGRGGTANDFIKWVEYCNSPTGSTTLAEQRARDGSPKPYGVRYWGIGNEPWGCGGVLTPEEYAHEYRRLSAWVPTYPTGSSGPKDPRTVLRLIAAGPLQDLRGGRTDDEWTRRFVESMLAAGRYLTMPWGYSIHSYFWRRDALNFTPAGWYSLLAQPRDVGSMLERQAALLRASRTPVTLVLDEWGSWYQGETGQTDPSHLFEQVPTLRDALVTALLFDIFHAHADVLSVATVAQTINCIHSLFLTQGEHLIRTPVYHAFALYQPHIGGTAVRTVAAADRITFKSEEPEPKPSWLDGISASATVHAASGAQRQRLVLTVTNPRLEQPVSATIALHDATICAGDVTQLTHSDPHARNTVTAPNMVQLGATTPLALASNTPSGTFTLTLAPASVTRVVCELGG